MFLSDLGHPHFFFSVCLPVIALTRFKKPPQINEQTPRQTKETATLQLEIDKKLKLPLSLKMPENKQSEVLVFSLEYTEYMAGQVLSCTWCTDI